jgi:hypothetical protein
MKSKARNIDQVWMTEETTPLGRVVGVSADQAPSDSDLTDSPPFGSG